MDADTLGKAPEGAKYLLAVTDPDHEVDQQEQVEMSAKY